MPESAALAREKSIKVLLLGLGNCANALIQGIHKYSHVGHHSPKTTGVMHNSIGGYLIRDIEIVAAIDVNGRKVGKDIAEAMWDTSNVVKKIAEVPKTGVIVQPGYVGDGVAAHMRSRFDISESTQAQVVRAIRGSGADICINFLPVGSEYATHFYARACLSARIAFINAIPALISHPIWRDFAKRRVPYAGHDIRSQFGSTFAHCAVSELIIERGLKILRTQQFNEGGGPDFDNMRDTSRVGSKLISKSHSIYDSAQTDDVEVIPAEYDPALGDTKKGRIVIEAEQFGGLRCNFEFKLEVQDSPNNAGVMVDVIRLMKLSMDRGLFGPQSDWEGYFFKSPSRLMPIRSARHDVDRFIEGPCELAYT